LWLQLPPVNFIPLTPRLGFYREIPQQEEAINYEVNYYQNWVFREFPQEVRG